MTRTPAWMSPSLPQGALIVQSGQLTFSAQAAVVDPEEVQHDKWRHADGSLVAQGDVAHDDRGLLLGKPQAETWACPYLWSGLKNVAARMLVEIVDAGTRAAVGIKLGQDSNIAGTGPRIMIELQRQRLAITGLSTSEPVLALEPGRPLDLAVAYAYDDAQLEVLLDGKRILKEALPTTPASVYMDLLGLPAPLAGLGIVSRDCRARVLEFAYSAGAPWRSVVAAGDGVVQQGPWLEAASHALGVPITNLGVTGDTAAMLALRFDRDVLALQPHRVILHAGRGDLVEGAAPEAVVNGPVAAMVQRAAERDIQVVLSELLPRRDSGAVEAFNRAIAALAQSRGVPLLRFHRAMLDASGTDINRELAPDGIHPSAAGGVAMASAMALDLHIAGV